MHDSHSLIGPGQMQVYPHGVGSLPLPFLKPNVIAEFMLPNGQRVFASIDKGGALLIWSPTATLSIVDNPDKTAIRIDARSKG